jgi:hypothetical protein
MSESPEVSNRTLSLDHGVQRKTLSVLLATCSLSEPTASQWIPLTWSELSPNLYTFPGGILVHADVPGS